MFRTILLKTEAVLLFSEKILLRLGSFRLKDARENQDDLGFGRILKSTCREQCVRSFPETDIRHFDFRRI